MRKIYLLFFLFLLSPIFSFATHLRAGEITATRISTTQLTYKITLVTYTDEINGKNANDGEEFVTFNFGFSTNKVEKIQVKRKEKILLNRSTVRNVYETIYTFPAAGYYTIGCGIVNRNENTINLPDAAGSSNISFFVQTSLLINSNIGFNSTPVLLNTPIDSAAVGQRFIHNPGAFDIDGDSLSYKLTRPRKDEGNETGVGQFISAYLEPNTVGPAPILNQAGTGPATFTINPRTGDLIWDVPRQAGQYNVAFVIEEWRKGYDGTYIKIGEIVRDMQIIVVETENKPPKLILPDDICIEAAEIIEFEVSGEDENQQTLKLSSSGGVFNTDPIGNSVDFIAPKPATFTSTPSVSKVKGKFVWETNCKHARQQPYNVIFKVEDSPGRFSTTLVDIKSLNIKILPPSPKGLIAETSSTGNVLKWNPLTTSCSTNGKILIYRKDGCSGLNPGACISGIPSSWSYKLIGEVNTSENTFLDKTADLDAIYSYRLVTQISENNFIDIQSAPSTEFCIGSEVKPGTSIITKVSVKETSKNAGQIDLNWSKPINVNLSTLSGPFLYKIYRSEGIGGESYQLISTINTDFTNPNDTIFVDKNLNTEEKIYRYKVEFYTQSTKLNATSNPATSVRLSAKTANEAVNLTWDANTPWNNSENKHYIFRENPSNNDELNLIKILEVKDPSTFNYLDKGEDSETQDGNSSLKLQNGETYCYVVMTQGQYADYKQFGILKNYSQKACATPMSLTPPCEPQIIVNTTIKCEERDAKDFCNEGNFYNTISWENPATGDCRNDIASYQIFYSRYDQGTLQLLANVQSSATNSFTHRKNSIEGYAGCYTIKAINSLGIESNMSQKICFDNCDKLEFPTAFSPNGDAQNETFTPMNCPAFVKTSEMKIYNAHGNLVRTINSEKIEWDGNDNNGKKLSSGTYYYSVKVNFEMLSVTGLEKEYKGYVTLIRE